MPGRTTTKRSFSPCLRASVVCSCGSRLSHRNHSGAPGNLLTGKAVYIGYFTSAPGRAHRCSTPSVPPSPTATASTRELGRGGMATVYLAEDLQHGRKVAIKVLRRRAPARAGCPSASCARSGSRRAWPIRRSCPLHDSGECDGLLYYVMPVRCRASRCATGWARGPPAGRRRAPHRARASPRRSTTRTASGVIHRDIKPENILLHEGEPVVADFGVATARSPRAAPGATCITEPGLAVGTPAYMSPEQASADAELDGRTDMYSLGVRGVRDARGRAAVRRQRPARRRWRGTWSSRRPRSGCCGPTCPLARRAALLRALAKEPEERFPTAGRVRPRRSMAAARTEPERCAVTGPVAERDRRAAVRQREPRSRERVLQRRHDRRADQRARQGRRTARRVAHVGVRAQGRQEDVRALGALLGVSAVLEGTVRKAGRPAPHHRAAHRRAPTGGTLWSERYDRDARGRVRHPGRDREDDRGHAPRHAARRPRRPGRRGATPPTSRRTTCTCKGRYCVEQAHPARPSPKAIRYFEQAIAADAGYALAYTGLADSLRAPGRLSRGVPVRGGHRAGQGSTRAGRSRSTRPWRRRTRRSAGSCSSTTGTGTAARREFRRAIELNPRYATARQWYSWLLIAHGTGGGGAGGGSHCRDRARPGVGLDPAQHRLAALLCPPVRGGGSSTSAARSRMNPTAEETHRAPGSGPGSSRASYDEAGVAFREAIALSTELPTLARRPRHGARPARAHGRGPRRSSPTSTRGSQDGTSRRSPSHRPPGPR